MADSSVKIQLGDVQQSVTCGICLQLLSDPRGLNCGHTYCLACLQGFQTSSSRKECPMCRADTVPAKDYLEKLPVNKLAVDLVKLVHTYDPSTEEAPVKWEPKKVERTSSPRMRRDRAAEIEALTSLFSRIRSIEEPSDGVTRHRNIICDECRTHNIAGHRYKCGICEDYDLCEECEAKPRSEVHDVEHLFLKLKKPRTSVPAFRRILHEDSTVMGMTQDSSQTAHKLRVSETQTISYYCDKCKKSPITGTRYKCGVCADYDLCEECEKTSENFHDPDHVFIVLRHPVGFHTKVPQLTYKFYR